jgi:NTE family protein
MRKIATLFLASLLALTCLAQENAAPPQAATQTTDAAKPQTNSRPSVGVALEGGGALGQAHVGVLKWFEEHHIPVDYIAGTSMGGLVGGLYATGKTSDQLREVLLGADWPLLLGGGTPYEDLSFRRKEDAREIPNSLQIGLKHGARLPPGLNTGQQVNLLIDRETLPYSTAKSFDDLPIPFRCVSTELVSGKAYVFQNGLLSDAMRATMSIPGVFAPVRQDDKIFVDGGMVDNLPTDVVRKMGADVVIAVHLQISKVSAKEIQSAFDVLGRSVALVISETELRGMEEADLVVRAKVEKYSTTDYEKTDELIQIGYDAAEAKAQILKPYELDDAAWAEYLKEKKSRVRTTIGTPQFIKLEGLQEPSAEENIRRLLQPLLGKPLSIPDIEGLLDRLSGIGRYDSLTYGMIQQGDQTGLLVRVHEKSYAPPTLLPEFEVDGTQTDDVTFTLGARLTFMDIAGFRSEWRNDFRFGETYGLSSDLYRPFHPLSKWFLDPFVDASQYTFLTYQKNNPRADYRIDRVYGGLNFGYGFSRFSELKIGYGVGYTNATLRLGTPDFASYDGRIGALQARYILDHTNDAVIPTKGYYVRSQFYYYDTYPGATQAFPSLDVLTQYFQPVFHGDSIFVVGSGGSTFGYHNIGAPQFFLGGVGRLTAYGLNELLGDQYFVGRVGYLHKVFTLPPFIGTQVYVSVFGEVGKMYDDPFPAPKLSGDGVAGLLAETAFGPVFIGGSVGDTGHHKWFFQLGRVF